MNGVFDEPWGLFPTMFVKISVAVLCGIMLGVEREIKDKPAGLRTIVLITVGATIYMIVSDLIAVAATGPEATTRVDPGRIASQVVTGIGFIGAGAILRARGAVHGLTTAAVIWVAAGIGLCIGLGFPLIGIATTIVVLFTLLLLNPLRRWLSRRAATQEISLIVANDDLVVRRLKSLFSEYDVSEKDYATNVLDADQIEMRVVFHAQSEATGRLLEALSGVPGVQGKRFA